MTILLSFAALAAVICTLVLVARRSHVHDRRAAVQSLRALAQQQIELATLQTIAAMRAEARRAHRSGGRP